MSVYIDRKFLGFVSSKLEQFRQKNTDLYNFRCPYCGDSKKNRLKARGYVYRKSNDYFFVCHNCGKSTTFAKFIEHVDGSSYKQYVLERYMNGETGNHNYKKPTVEPLRGSAFERFSTKTPKLSTFTNLNIASLSESHYARTYIKDRKIPVKHWGEIFFVEKFKEFLDQEFPEHGKEDIPNDDRIVLFYTNESGEITSVAGRALSNTKIRYVQVKIGEEKKVFGLHRLRKQEKVYVVEGQFDSFFLDNSVASGDSNLSGMAEFLRDSDVVLVYDNEPRNKDLVRQINSSIERGHKVCLLPETVDGKDINEMVQKGLTSEQIQSIIDDNTFTGLTANLKFTNWKRC